MLKTNFSELPVFSGRKLMFNSMLWLVICCATLLFLPESVLQGLGLYALVSANNHFIGLGMIIGIAYFIARLMGVFLDEGIRYLSDKRLIENIEHKVSLLDLSERALLREFFLQGATILTLPQNETPVKSLLNAGILECLGNEKHYAIHGPTAEYKISMKARSYLNRQILRLPSGQPTQEEMQALIKTRPTFINHIAQPRKHAA
ncbi:superinfection exclusion B family protein [Shewanella corallii]|uniref:Superinfection exclusion B family protein n=2 Tax=Shewanella TaxID=22 RepID=A0ABT0N1W1_9GAMM|nr:MULTISPECIES: superinfection exclusion B family protein [Shewanella]MCL1035791.1 superinfection exclusion B family protein [Shewanella submarina]MCL2912422.1 superinfection exclusion B family protein [Shewanella corallii]